MKFSLKFKSYEGEITSIDIEAETKDKAIEKGYEEVSSKSLEKSCVDLCDYKLETITQI